MSAALVELGGADRTYHFFDSFEGLPAATEIDGPAALAWQAEKTSPNYHDNCTATEEEFKAVLGRSGVGATINVHKGFFEETFRNVDVADIAVLRLDADWYSSTMSCLEKFWDSVLPNGIVLIDDYDTWDGCTKAVHDFLSKRQAPEGISRGSSAAVPYIIKR